MADDDVVPATHLADALQKHAALLAQSPIEEMYGDLFWQERFAARGRHHAEQDGRHHITYLVEALRLGSPSTLVSYARWLRTLLVAHGMCTADLASNFARIAHAVARLEVPNHATAIAYLQAAQEGLAYEHDEARGLCAAHTRLAAAARLRLAQAGDLALASRLHADPEHLLSYLSDALAIARPDLLRAHAAWASAALLRHGASTWGQITEALLQALRDERADWARAAETCAAFAFAPARVGPDAV